MLAASGGRCRRRAVPGKIRVLRGRSRSPPLPPVQLIGVLHRLAGRTGHRFNQALGIEEEARRRGMAPLLLIHAEAEPEVRAALPAALPVLHDPVFRRDWSFDRRTADFAAMP